MSRRSRVVVRAILRVGQVSVAAWVAWLVHGLVYAAPAAADNCSVFTDCFGQANSAAEASFGLAMLAALSFILNFVPVIGDAKGVIEGITGEDLLTGQRLEWWERALGALPFVPGVGAFGHVPGAFGDLAHGAGAFGDAAHGAGAIGDAARGAGAIGDAARGAGAIGDAAHGAGAIGDAAHGAGGVGDAARGADGLGGVARAGDDIGDAARGSGDLGGAGRGADDIGDLGRGGEDIGGAAGRGGDDASGGGRGGDPPPSNPRPPAGTRYPVDPEMRQLVDQYNAASPGQKGRISEQLGELGGRSYLRDVTGNPDLDLFRPRSEADVAGLADLTAAGRPWPHAVTFGGAHATNLVYFDGRTMHIIEAKGGSSPYATRQPVSPDVPGLSQTDPSYPRVVAGEMANSPVQDGRNTIGEMIEEAYRSGDVRYVGVRTGPAADIRSGAVATEVEDVFLEPLP